MYTLYMYIHTHIYIYVYVYIIIYVYIIMHQVHQVALEVSEEGHFNKDF